MSVRRGWLLSAVVCALAAAPVPARAQPAEAPTAVSLAGEAKAHYDRGEWAEALSRFEQAETLAHSPVIVLYIARCQRNLGRLVAARDSLRRVTTEELAADAPPPFVTAKADAENDLRALEPRIATVTVEVDPALADATIELDDRELGSGERSSVAVDPGQHVVRAKRGANVVTEVAFSAAEGQSQSVALRVATTAPPPVPSPVPAADTGDGSGGSLVPGIVVIGLGTAGLAAGIVTRVMAFQKVSDVKDRCVDGHCLLEDESEIDSANTLQTVSTICFIAGGAAVAAGVVLLVVAPGGEDQPAVSLRAGPTWVGVDGVF